MLNVYQTNKKTGVDGILYNPVIVSDMYIPGMSDSLINQHSNSAVDAKINIIKQKIKPNMSEMHRILLENLKIDQVSYDES